MRLLLNAHSSAEDLAGWVDKLWENDVYYRRVLLGFELLATTVLNLDRRPSSVARITGRYTMHENSSRFFCTSFGDLESRNSGSVSRLQDK